VPEQLVLFFNDLLKMGLTHLKINDAALEVLNDLLLLFVVLLAFLLLLLTPLELL